MQRGSQLERADARGALMRAEVPYDRGIGSSQLGTRQLPGPLVTLAERNAHCSEHSHPQNALVGRSALEAIAPDNPGNDAKVRPHGVHGPELQRQAIRKRRQRAKVRHTQPLAQEAGRQIHQQLIHQAFTHQ